MSAEFPTDAEAERLGEIVTDAVAAITGDTLALDAAAEAVPEIVRHLAPLIRAREAVAWDAGARAAWERSTPEVNGLHYHWRSSGEPLNPYERLEGK